MTRRQTQKDRNTALDVAMLTLIMMRQYAKIQRRWLAVWRGNESKNTTGLPFGSKILTAAFPYRWGVVQPVGHRTVNADGEGSNPSAPATHFVTFSPGFSMG
jgi:hypothetical protein